jgi:hypothetical protein
MIPLAASPVADPRTWLIVTVPLALVVHLLVVRFVDSAELSGAAGAPDATDEGAGSAPGVADAVAPVRHWRTVSRTLAASLALLAFVLAVFVSVVPSALLVTVVTLGVFQIAFATVVVYRTVARSKETGTADQPTR